VYTLGSAYASFDEHERGSIEPGKLADVVMLSDDPTTCDPESIGSIEVRMTMVGGKMVYRAE
jgi:predicted amidohydrolase YtcJ